MTEQLDTATLAMQMAMEAKHAAELALIELRGHEKLCIERGDRMIESQNRTEKQNDEIRADQRRLHEQLTATTALLGGDIKSSHKWTVGVVIAGLVGLCSFLVGFAYWLSDHLPLVPPQHL